MLHMHCKVFQRHRRPRGRFAWALGCAAALLCTQPRQTSAQARSNASATNNKSRMDMANKCLSKGDNECVIRVLEGWANTQQELGMLIETYRALRQDDRAHQVMHTYIERFPDAARAASYRRMLEIAEQTPQPTAADKKPAPTPKPSDSKRPQRTKTSPPATK